MHQDIFRFYFALSSFIFFSVHVLTGIRFTSIKLKPLTQTECWRRGEVPAPGGFAGLWGVF
ncbi:MAG: hypothetical protein AB7D51_12915, partial [Desulfovibrionaceae bacterium]